MPVGVVFAGLSGKNVLFARCHVTKNKMPTIKNGTPDRNTAKTLL